MKLQDALQDCTAGRIQSVGNMSIIPLLSNVVDESVISPLEAGTVSNRAYGELRFDNPTEKTMVTPSHVGYLTKKAAQDHAMASAGVVGAKSSETFGNAQCVERTQGGYMKTDDEKQAIMLPLGLRHEALRKRNERFYSKLWDGIGRYNQEVGIADHGHIKLFFSQYEKQLNEFVAEFEPVPDQVGAIVLINGQVFGIERSPNHAYWLSIWKIVIRDCYGSEALRQARKHPGLKADLRVPLREATSLDDLSAALEEASQKERTLAGKVVEDMNARDLKTENDGTMSGVAILTIVEGGLFGQVLMKAGVPIYVSLFSESMSKRYGQAFSL